MRYPLHKDFKKFAHAHPPLSFPILPLVKGYGKILFLSERTKKGILVKKIRIPVSDKNSVGAIIYTPTGQEERKLPCLLFFHGGGYAMPAGKYHYRLARTYAEKIGCKVVIFDYRLSPKYKYPVPIEDCYAAYLYLLVHAEEMGVEKEKIAFIGDSAGATLAAVTAERARRNRLPSPCAQLLLYPASGPFFDTESAKAYPFAPMCSKKDFEKFQKLYIGKEKIEEEELAPYLAVHADTPPTYVETAEIDFLRCCGEIYAEKLREKGVACVYYRTKGTCHAYDMEQSSSVTQASVQKRVEFLKDIFAKCG